MEGRSEMCWAIETTTLQTRIGGQREGLYTHLIIFRAASKRSRDNIGGGVSDFDRLRALDSCRLRLPCVLLGPLSPTISIPESLLSSSLRPSDRILRWVNIYWRKPHDRHTSARTCRAPTLGACSRRREPLCASCASGGRLPHLPHHCCRKTDFPFPLYIVLLVLHSSVCAPPHLSRSACSAASTSCPTDA